MARRQRRGPVPTWRVELFAGYWFVTAAVATGGIVLAVVVLLIDGAAGRAGVLGAMAISPAAARTILGSISGSLITIASLTASLTIVTLQLLSNQYTPRTVRGFLRRKVSQVVSGAFVGIFLYCLVLLLFVRQPGDENDPFVPPLGVVLSVVLATAALLLLVLFINALARTIQVSTMTSEIAAATAAVIDERSRRTTADPAAGARAATASVRSASVGYVRSTVPQTVADRVPEGLRGLLRIDVRPGDFVTTRTVLASWSADPGSAPWDPAALESAVRAAVLVSAERDLDDDPEFGVRQLTDIALRALSPGINDPSTAVACIGYLRQVFERVAACPLLPLVADRGGVTVVATERSFDEFADVLGEVAECAAGNLRVTATLADAVLVTAAAARDAGFEDRAARLDDEARLVVAEAGRHADGLRARALVGALEQRLAPGDERR